MGGGLQANRMTARDAEDALAALRLLPSRAEQSLDHRGSIILGVKTNPLLRAPTENFASNRRDHTRSLSSLPGVTLPMPPSTLKELEQRQRQPQQRVYRDPVRASRTLGRCAAGPLTRRLAPQLTGEGIRNSWEESNKPVYFSALEVPFGAKGSKARKAFTKEVYDKPRTRKSAGAALNAGEDAMYLKPEVCGNDLTVSVTQNPNSSPRAHPESGAWPGGANGSEGPGRAGSGLRLAGRGQPHRTRRLVGQPPPSIDRLRNRAV